MATENQPALSIKVTVGDLTVIATGVANFPIEKQFRIQIEGITIEFVLEKHEEGKTDFERKAIPERLVYQYIVRGKIPESPATFGLRFPDNIGTANGYPIWFTFGLTALGTDGKGVSLHYTVYQGDRQAPQKVEEKEASNV